MDAGNHQHIIPSLRETTKASDTLEHQTTVWPVRVLTRAQNISPGRRASAMFVPSSPRSSVPRPSVPAFRVLTCSRPTSPSPKSGSTKSRSSKSRESKWVQRFHSMPRIDLCSSGPGTHRSSKNSNDWNFRPFLKPLIF